MYIKIYKNSCCIFRPCVLVYIQLHNTDNVYYDVLLSRIIPAVRMCFKECRTFRLRTFHLRTVRLADGSSPDGSSPDGSSLGRFVSRRFVSEKLCNESITSIHNNTFVRAKIIVGLAYSYQLSV